MSKINVIISDRMTTSLLSRRWYSASARSTLAITKARSEIVIPFYNWLQPDGSINEVELKKDQATKHLANEGTFHGLIYIHPLKAHYRFGFDEPRAMPQVVRSLRSQIAIARRLCNPERPYALLVVHLGLSQQADFKPFFRNVISVMQQVADDADAQKVMISLEPDPIQTYGYTPGTVPQIYQLIPQLEAIAPRRNLRTPFSITFDLAHTYLSFKKDYKTVQRIIQEAGDRIYYAHINAPIYRGTPGVTIEQGRPIPTGRLQRWIFDTRNIIFTEDGHGSLDRIPEQQRTDYEETIRLLGAATRIPEFGCINLEITPRIDRPFEFWRAGSTSAGALYSAELLNRILNG